jgi:hypothetical protein
MTACEQKIAPASQLLHDRPLNIRNIIDSEFEEQVFGIGDGTIYVDEFIARWRDLGGTSAHGLRVNHLLSVYGGFHRIDIRI